MQTLVAQRCQLRIAAFVLCAPISVPIFISDAAFAQEKEHQPTIGKLVVQTIPAKHYLHGGFETDFKSMGEPVGNTLTELMGATREKKVGLHGPVIHYYYGAPHRDPGKRFKMETGFFVPDDSAAVGKFKPRELPTFKCATILYIGPATKIGDAWQQLYRSVRDLGLTATDEERELYLYWEDVDSPNNIVQVQLGVKQSNPPPKTKQIITEELQQEITQNINDLGNSGLRSKAVKNLVKIGNPAIPALIEAFLGGKDAGHYAAVTLSKIKDKSAIPGLIEALKNKSDSVRMIAAITLGEIPDKSAVPALIEALKDDSRYVRYQSIIALGRNQDKSAVPALIELLNDNERQIRFEVAKTLGLIQDKSAIPALTEALKDKDPQVRRNAATALGQINDKSAIPALIEAMKDDDPSVRQAATEALDEIREKAE